MAMVLTIGVSQCLIQLAKTEGAKMILATAGSDEKTKLCESLGATKGINYKKSDWAVEVKKLAPDGVDLVVDYIMGLVLSILLQTSIRHETNAFRSRLSQEGLRSHCSRCNDSLSCNDGRGTN